MFIAACAFAVVGMVSLVAIALFPHKVQRHVDRSIVFVRARWARSNTLERIGLVLMIVPCPGPFDEIVGILFLGAGRLVRWIRREPAVEFIQS